MAQGADAATPHPAALRASTFSRTRETGRGRRNETKSSETKTKPAASFSLRFAANRRQKRSRRFRRFGRFQSLRRHFVSLLSIFAPPVASRGGAAGAQIPGAVIGSRSLLQDELYSSFRFSRRNCRRAKGRAAAPRRRALGETGFQAAEADKDAPRAARTERLSPSVDL